MGPRECLLKYRAWLAQGDSCLGGKGFTKKGGRLSTTHAPWKNKLFKSLPPNLESDERKETLLPYKQGIGFLKQRPSLYIGVSSRYRSKLTGFRIR